MAIDLNKLMNGEKVICPHCGKGILMPLNNTKPNNSSQFKCSECGEKLILHRSIKSYR